MKSKLKEYQVSNKQARINRLQTLKTKIQVGIEMEKEQLTKMQLNEKKVKITEAEY